MGTTTKFPSSATENWDHPHIRGDHTFYLYRLITLIGSPPHTWGPRPICRRILRRDRITPTYVGTTLQCQRNCSGVWDHPHIRGDHQITTRGRQNPIGSPPHTWGPQNPGAIQPGSVRITPTYVGTTAKNAGLDLGI